MYISHRPFPTLTCFKHQAGVTLTKQPCSIDKLIPNFWMGGRSSRRSIALNACNKRNVIKAICVNANCCPMQMRGPALNGRYSYLIVKMAKSAKMMNQIGSNGLRRTVKGGGKKERGGGGGGG